MLLDFNTADSQGQFMLTWVGVALTTLLYFTLTAFGIRNFFKYIVKQENYQLKLLYIFVILASSGRLGRYFAMIINLILGNSVHT